MALLKVNNVRIAGISAGVPKNIVKNTGNEIESKEYDASDFVETTGVAERRVTNELTTSDLCYGAAEKLIADLGWDKSEIQALFFITQFPDYIIPATSCILQNKLGLSRDCYAMDISLGCSGWVYGLCSLASLMQTGNIRKALLLAGDGKRTTEHFRRWAITNTVRPFIRLSILAAPSGISISVQTAVVLVQSSYQMVQLVTNSAKIR